MSRRTRLLVSVLVASSTGCLGLFDDPPADVPTPQGSVLLSLAPGRAWFNATLDAPRASVGWTLLRGVAVVDSGNATRIDETHFVAFTPRSLAANGTWNVRFSDAGLLVAERRFEVASVDWAPAAPGLWAFAAARGAGTDAAMRLDGTLRNGAAGWRLDAAGTFRDATPNGTLAGEILHYAAEGRDETHVVVRVVVHARLSDGSGSPIGNVSTERVLLREGRAADRAGLVHDAFLLRAWSRLDGRLVGSGDPAPVDTVTIVEQWVARDGTALSWNRTTFDNVTRRTSRDGGFGDGDDSPEPLQLARSLAPRPLAAGDRFVGGGATFVAAAVAGGLEATAPSASLRLLDAGRGLTYERTFSNAGGATRIAIGPAR